MNSDVPSKSHIIERANATTAKLTHSLERYKKIAAISNISRIVLASAIPILVSLSSHEIKLLILVSLSGALMGIIQGVDAFYKVSDKIAHTQQLILFVNREVLLLTSENSPYDSEDEEENVKKFIATLADALDDVMSNIDNN